MTAQEIDVDSITIHGRQAAGTLYVSAADLLAAGGLLDLDPSAGAAIVLETGAVLRGIRMLGYEDPDTLTRPDETLDLAEDRECYFSLASEGVASVMNEDLSMAAEHRLRVTNSFIPEYTGDGFLTENMLLMIYRSTRSRWAVPWSATTPFMATITSADTAPSVTAGSPITYTATAAEPTGVGVAWALVPNAIGVTIAHDTGVMSGGAAAPVGTHTLMIVCAGWAGSQAIKTITWTVDAP